jgi:D-xylose transport system permease protein
MLIALGGMWLIFSILTPGNVFISPTNLSNLFSQTVPVAIAAVGMTLIIVTKNIDLSVGSVAAFTGALAAFMEVKLGLPTSVALAGSVLAGVLVGLWHGFWIGYRMVPAFIVTLASMMIFRGAVLGLTHGETIAPLSNLFASIGQDYLTIGVSTIIGILTVIVFLILTYNHRKKRMKYGFVVPTTFHQLVKSMLVVIAIAAFFSILIINKGIPYSVLLLMLIVGIFHILSKNTIFGRQLYAIGGNSEASALSGINIRKNTMALYVVFGALTAVSGITLTSRLNAATTSAGTGMELDVIAAVVIGGTSLMGGEGTVFGSIIGALIMTSLDNGMSLMNTDVIYQYVIKGLILLFAVWFDIETRRQSH